MTVKTGVIDIFKGTFPQLFAAVSGTLFAISDGMTVGWTAPMIPYLISKESHIKTTRHEAEWLETALLVGAFCGLPSTMFFTEKIGRKRSLLLASVVVLFAWAAIALGNNMIYLFVARFFFGVAGNMAFVAAPMYVAEIADQKIRGFLSSIIYLMMLTGCLIVYCVGPFLPFYASPVIGICIALTELAVFSFMPESPYYLLYKNKPEEAKKSLTYFRSNANVDMEMKEISNAIERQKTEKGRIQDLLIIDSNRKALLIMTLLNAGQNFCGIGVIMMNLHLILSEAGSIYLDEATTGIIFAVIMLVSATAASLQLDKYGRKLLLITSAILTGICLLVIAIYFNMKHVGYNVISVSWIPIVTVMTYALTFKIGLGIVPIVITAEVFPAKMKAIGMTIADAMYVVWGIITLQVYQWLNTYGLHVSFYLFAVCSFSLGAFTQWYIPETKGKTLEEIQYILKGRRFSEINKASVVVLFAWMPIALGNNMIHLVVARLFCGVAGNMTFVAAVNKPEEAKESLTYFRSNANVDMEMKEISNAIERQKTEKGRIQDLLIIDSNRKALLIMTLLNAGQNFRGIGVIMMNLHLILSEAGSIYLDEATTGIIFAVIMLVSATAASLQLDKYGRKLLLITSAILTGICLLVIAIYFNMKHVGYNVISVSWIPIVTVMTYALTFKIGLGIVPIVITAEVFPAKMKAIGMTIADAMYVVWGIITLQVYQWLNTYGLHVSFYLFAVCSFSLGAFTQWYIPETKGKTLEEIQYILKGRRFSEINNKGMTPT